MSQITVAQVMTVLSQIFGLGLIIVLLSFPITKFANYCQHEWTPRAQPSQVEQVPAPRESWLPMPVQRLLGRSSPPSTLVPPPPPLAY